MNVQFTPLENAYKIDHIHSSTYNGSVFYSPICIYCSHKHSNSLMNDGGAFRQCQKCKKNFRANVMTPAIQNFVYSTRHLNGTN